MNDHIKPGDIIVAKVDGSTLTCYVSAVGEKIILVVPIRTHRFALSPPHLAILPSDIISHTSND